MIEHEKFPEHYKLPSERELAEKFEVQRDTIRAALDFLLQKKLIYVKEKSGYYVSPKRLKVDLNDLRSTGSILVSLGKDTSVNLLEFDLIKADRKLAEKIMIAEGAEVYRLIRLRYEDRTPFAVERSYITYEYAPGLKPEDLEHGSLYRVLKNNFNISFNYSNQRVSVVNATGLEAELLNVNKYTPLMKFEGLVYDKKDRMVEYFDNITLMEKIEFVTERF